MKTILVAHQQADVRNALSKKLKTICDEKQILTVQSKQEIIDTLDNRALEMILIQAEFDKDIQALRSELYKRCSNLPLIVLTSESTSDRCRSVWLENNANVFIAENIHEIELKALMRHADLCATGCLLKAELPRTNPLHENTYQQVFEQSMHAVFCVDLQGDILLINPKAASYFDGRFNEYVGKNLTHFFDAERAEAYIKNIKRIIRGKKLFCTENEIELNQKKYWFHSCIQPLCRHEAVSDEPEMALVITTDVTQFKKNERELIRSRKEYQELYNMMRLMCDNVPDMIWAKNLNNEYVFTNKAMCDHLLIAENTDEPVGKNDMFFAERQRLSKADDPEWHTFGEICRDTDTIVKKNQKPQRFDEYGNVRGKFLFLDVHKAPFWDKNKQMIGTVGCGRDMTQEKHNQSEREQLIAELESKNRELERFSYTVSHDLRSPLITIKGFLGLIEKDVLRGDVKSFQKDKEFVTNAVEKMDVLLKEILDLSRIGRVANTFTELSLRDVVGMALELTKSRIEQADAVIEVDDLPVVRADKVRMSEVYTNLIDNAIKFRRADVCPQIHIGYRKDRDKTVFFVKDNGIGVASEFHQTIFGLFDKLNVNVEGSGAGLAIVQRIIEAHGGRLWVESAGNNEGARFCFTLDESVYPY